MLVLCREHGDQDRAVSWRSRGPAGLSRTESHAQPHLAALRILGLLPWHLLLVVLFFSLHSLHIKSKLCVLQLGSKCPVDLL